MNGRLRDGWALCATLTRYWLLIRPRASRELKRLRLRAERIPDPILRRQAGFVLGEESWTIEGAAFFATLVPRRHLPAAVRSMVQFQALYMYLDGLGEERAADQLGDGAKLQAALLDALDRGRAGSPHHLDHGRGDDGAFIDELVASCQESLRSLPSFPLAVAGARRLAARCQEGQIHTHSAVDHGLDALRTWATQQQGVEGGYTWWEVAAGAVNTISIHALFAAAGDPQTTAGESERVESAYFPGVCVLTTLLDSLIDHDHDADTGNFSFISQYETDRVAAERLGAIAREADRDVRSLARGATMPPSSA